MPNEGWDQEDFQTAEDCFEAVSLEIAAYGVAESATLLDGGIMSMIIDLIIVCDSCETTDEGGRG